MHISYFYRFHILSLSLLLSLIPSPVLHLEHALNNNAISLHINENLSMTSTKKKNTLSTQNMFFPIAVLMKLVLPKWGKSIRA